MTDRLAFHFRMVVQNWVYRKLLKSVHLVLPLECMVKFLPMPVREELISSNLLPKISVVRNLSLPVGYQ